MAEHAQFNPDLTPPQSGESSGEPLAVTENYALQSAQQLSLQEILSNPHIDPVSIPYYQEVHQDVLDGRSDWPVTKKVQEYAAYLAAHPETVKTLPPIQIVDGKLKDGAHRISAIYLLSKQFPGAGWDAAKLPVDFYETKPTPNRF